MAFESNDRTNTATNSGGDLHSVVNQAKSFGLLVVKASEADGITVTVINKHMQTILSTNQILHIEMLAQSPFACPWRVVIFLLETEQNFS